MVYTCTEHGGGQPEISCQTQGLGTDGIEFCFQNQNMCLPNQRIQLGLSLGGTCGPCPPDRRTRTRRLGSSSSSSSSSNTTPKELNDDDVDEKDDIGHRRMMRELLLESTVSSTSLSSSSSVSPLPKGDGVGNVRGSSTSSSSS